MECGDDRRLRRTIRGLSSLGASMYTMVCRWGTPHQWLESTANFETEVTDFFELQRPLVFDAQALGHFFVEKAFALPVGLDPFAVNDELRDGALTGALDYFVGGSGRVFDIDFVEWDAVLLQEAFGFATVRAPVAAYKRSLSS